MSLLAQSCTDQVVQLSDLDLEQAFVRTGRAALLV